jgi:hypothetical protein
MGEMAKTEAIAELATLANEINAEHRAFVGSLKKTAEHGIRAGELLAEAKSKCKHGEWLPWLSQNFEGAPRTAQEYMRLYNHRDEIRAKYADSAHLSISGTLRELAAPKEQENETGVDKGLEAAHEEAQKALAYHRWHWTTDESNPRRVSVEDYARQVGKHKSEIRKYVDAYELTTGRSAKALEAQSSGADEGMAFEDMVELTSSLRTIRDKELFREKGYETFEAYMLGEWPKRGKDLLGAMSGWELVIDNPPPEMRGAKVEKAKELTDRLKELMTVPESDAGLVAAGRQLQEVEDRELYKLIGYSTFSGFCREALGLNRKYQSLFSLVVEMADIHPMFNVDEYDMNEPLPQEPELSGEDWKRGIELMTEFAELTGEE